MKIHIDWIGGYCPVQAEGRVDGHAFYFRSRGERWSFEIGSFRLSGWVGPWPQAGWMEHKRALKIIWKCAWKFHRARNPHEVPEVNRLEIWQLRAQVKALRGNNA